MNEAETCRRMVRPRLEQAGWDASKSAHHFYEEQADFTDGRIVTSGDKPVRLKRKFADFLLRYTRDIVLGVVEAKSANRPAGDGLQQAKEYAEILGLKFAYATNGREIIEYDYFTNIEREIDEFPSPDELWERYRVGQKLGVQAASALLLPYHVQGNRLPRYYQKIAITRTVEAILSGKTRNLLTMATGTGKTQTAFQICWKLWSSAWNAKNEHSKKPRILFLADRNVLVDDPYAKDFSAFGDARHKISGEVVKSREMYFALYQALSGDENRTGLYTQFDRDFFDLIVIDECHRGSSRDDSSWREILEYFEPAYQLGMTATPLRDDNRDSYEYFGEPLYTYSLKQGIEDGFLAPYRVHRVLTTFDATGFRPTQGQLDRHGRQIPDQMYHTKDFERTISISGRTEAIAKHLTEHLRKTDPYGKTIIFCVDQEHADQMRRALHNLNTPLVKEAEKMGQAYVARVTADEGDIGRGHLGKFQDTDERFPVILTTSQLLSTGVDAPTCANVVLVREVGSMSEFKQIIGRGTRVREDKGKLFFNILDYTGTATKKFADPTFDGDPVKITSEEIDDEGNTVEDSEETEKDDNTDSGSFPEYDDDCPVPRKLYIHGGPTSIDTEVTMDLDADGHVLRSVQLRKAIGDAVRELFVNAETYFAEIQTSGKRENLIEALRDKGIDFSELTQLAGTPDADPFDVLAHLGYDLPLQSRRQRVERLRSKGVLFAELPEDAQRILALLLDKYAEHGVQQLVMPDALEVPPISDYGNVKEIGKKFGGTDKLLETVEKLCNLLYSV